NMGSYYHTAYLTGDNSVGERIYTYNELQSDDEDKTEILFSVDILNEGVDIPAINMVLFLRPTDSSTVFIQQLGRGLRKYEGKEYVTVLDLIGNNYRRSVQIAFALCSVGQNLVFDKPTIKGLILDNFEPMGLSEYGVKIFIDEKSQEEILRSLDRENLNSRSYLEQDYKNFKIFTGASPYPSHMEYLNSDCAPDILRFINAKTSGKKNGSYYVFLKSIGEEGLPTFTEEQIRFINELSSYLPLVRKHEYLLVKGVLEGICGESALREYLMDNTGGFTDEQMKHALDNLKCLRKEQEAYMLTASASSEFTEYVKDLIEYGLGRYDSEYGDDTEDFKPYLTYMTEQVNLKLLQNPKDTMKGTHYVDSRVVIFASLHKDESVENRLKYEDKFVSPGVFQWESVSDIKSKEKQRLINSDFAYLFIRKVKSEFGQTLPYTYVGKGRLVNPRDSVRNDAKGSHPTVLFDIELEKELPEYLQFDFGLKD
ncbi:MAG: DUF3427 domain-containing protein, partial [Clostridia bacterium]|nr:DUF3427 domain-containing protein [Clostridia bacterium]